MGDVKAVPVEGKLSDQAFEMIKRLIIRCDLRPGNEVTEAQLSVLTGLGKAPIRAALARLSQRGLVFSVQRRGYRIAPITVRDITNIYQLRLFIEPQIARLAAEKVIPPDVVERLRDLAAAGYEKEDGDSTSDFLDKNRRFHLSIAQLTGNDRLIKLMEQLFEEMDRLFYVGLSIRNRSSEMRREHQALIDAIINGEAERAEKVAAAEITTSQKMVIEAVLQESEFFDTNILELDRVSLITANSYKSARLS